MKQYRDTDYWVNEKGEVFRNGKQLKPQMKKRKGKDRYYYITLSKNNKPVCDYIHRMVGELYIPNPDNLPEIDHLDGNRFNNHYTNLEWVTSKENHDRAKQKGLIETKLTIDDIKWIKKNCVLNHETLGLRAIGRKFNVHMTLIRDIMNNKVWKDVS